MNHSNQHKDSISTVQLSPFGEDHWQRIVTYSPIYVHWTDMIMMSQPRQSKITSRKKRNLIGHIDMISLKLEDELLLHELDDIRRIAVIPSLTTLKGKHTYRESNISDEEQDQRTTSPTDEYQRSEDFFHQTREISKPRSSVAEPSFSQQQNNVQRSVVQTRTVPIQSTSIGPIKTLSNIGLGPKPQASLSVQLRQSAITREHALTTANEHRSSTPLSMSSSKRTAGCGVGSAHSSRRNHLQPSRSLNLQTPPLSSFTKVNPTDGFPEQLRTDLSSSLKKRYPRSTNTSRSTMCMVKTKNERTRQKQHIELKTILVQPCRQPMWSDGAFEESIPNSIEIMRKIGGPVTVFERNLRQTYHKQLTQYRNAPIKC